VITIQPAPKSAPVTTVTAVVISPLLDPECFAYLSDFKFVQPSLRKDDAALHLVLSPELVDDTVVVDPKR